MTGETISHFKILDKLGGGGMGVVYVAEDTRLDRRVALKFLPPHLSTDAQAKQRFVQEARAASGLNHENICTVYDIGETDDGQTFIAMALYEGETLRQKLERGALPAEEAVGIARQIAEGLSAAHEQGIIHRDIKPANIFVTQRGRAIILDFGLAKLTGALELTQSGSTLGTAYYMAPEQIRSEPVDQRTDLWSLGVVLYEMLTGRRPFTGDYEQAVSYAILNEEIECTEPEVPNAVAATVTRLLSKKKEGRFANADEVVAALDPSAVRSHGAAQRSASPAIPTKWVAGSAGVLLLAVLLVWAVGRERPNSSESPGIETNPNMVVILPFSVQGSPDMQYLSDGMVTLLTTMLDGTGPIAAADHNAVISRVQRESGDVHDPAVAVEIAREFGASRVVLGSVVLAGNQVRLDARLYGADGQPESEASASYRGDQDFTAAVDELAAELVGGMISNPAEIMGSLAVGTTDSFEALKHYLNAQSMYTGAEFDAAKEEVEAALAIDSTFALAWYLHAEIMGWVDVGGTRKSLDMARKYIDQLSGRARRMLEGRIAFDDGRYNDARQIYRGLIRDYPADVEAKGQLAEVLVHYESRESAQWEALSLFQRISELAPDNQQFAMHHADLLAMKGMHTGDFYGLDSLAAVYAGLSKPERGDTLDWSLALDRMSSDTRRYMVMYARIQGTPEDSAASYEMDTDPQFDAGRFGRMGLWEAEEATFASAERGDGPVEAAYPVAAYFIPRLQGRFGVSRAHRPGLIRRFGSSWMLATDILEAGLSAFDVDPDSLESLQSALGDWRPETEPLRGYAGYGTALKAYLAATVAWRSGDSERFGEERAAFARTHHDTTSSPVLRSLARELEALDLWRRGNQSEAISTMRRARQEGVYFLDMGFDPIAGRKQPTWYLAEMLEKTGSLEEALEWYSAQAPFYWGVHTAPGWERMAALHERLGNNDDAIRYYRLATDRWERADDFLQPRVAEMRARIDALLRASAREGR